MKDSLVSSSESLSLVVCNAAGEIKHQSLLAQQLLANHEDKNVAEILPEYSVSHHADTSTVIKHLNLQQRYLSRITAGQLIEVIPCGASPNSDLISIILLPVREEQLAQIHAIKKLKKLNEAVSSAEIGLWEYHVTSGESEFSAQLIKMIGLQEHSSLSWQDFIGHFFDEDQLIFNSYINHHVEFNIPLVLEVRMMINNYPHWFTIKGSKTNEANEVVISGSLTDTTTEKEILNKLGAAIDSRKLAMSAASIGTWSAESFDRKHFEWTWDDQASQIFHLEKNNIDDMKVWMKRLHPDDKDNVINALKHSIKTGEVLEQKYRFLLPNNETIYVYAKGAACTSIDEKSIRIDGVCIDQTKTIEIQKQLRQLNLELEDRVKSRTHELEAARDRAEKASQTKTQFLAMMSHELRTPMNAIIGSLDLLALSEHDFESRDLIDTAAISANNLILILNDILDINKIEAGKMEFENKPFSIFEVINNVIKNYIPVADKKGVLLKVYEDPRIPNMLESDPVRIKQILFNLVGNAIKFTDNSKDKAGVVSLHAELIESQGSLQHFRFSIKDSGIGMTTETINKLFTPFTQAEASTTRKYGGTGLGLAICGKLVDMMGGLIEVNSELGLGSEFIVELPLWKGEQINEDTFSSLANSAVVMINTDKSQSPFLDHLSELLTPATSSTTIQNIFDSKSTLPPPSIVQGDIFLVISSDLSGSKALIQHINHNAGSPAKVIIIADHSQLVNSKNLGIHQVILSRQSTTKYMLLHAINSVLRDKVKVNNGHINADLLDISLDFELPQEPKQHEDSSLKTGVLLVEDNPFNQKLFLKQLRTLGYSCDIAEDGLQGITSWRENNYKLILTDCHMPNMDGYEMTKLIRREEDIAKSRVQIPIIAVTGAAMVGDREHCKSLGMNDFISKPIQLNEFEKVLTKWYPQ